MYFVANKKLMWQTYRTSEDLHTRPSELLGIGYAWVAMDFDAAVSAWGKHVERKMREARDEEQALARSRKKSASAEKMQQAAQEAFNRTVLGVERRERVYHSFAHQRPVKLVEELREVNGVKQWVEVSKTLMDGHSASVMGV